VILIIGIERLFNKAQTRNKGEKAMLMVTFLFLLLLPSPGKESKPFEGYRALVVEPENFWGWDAAIFGALQERGLEVVYAKPEALKDFGFLSQFDLVATNIRRYFAPKQVKNLEKFLSRGGALYGSWGGPMFTPRLLRICQVARTKSVWIDGFVLLESPLSKGIKEKRILFPEVIGPSRSKVREIVSVEPLPGGVPVAVDKSGKVLGVLGRYGKGRTAILGFGPENEKYFQRREIGPIMLDNLLRWLLSERLTSKREKWSGRIEVALPARVRIREVYINGRRLLSPKVRRFGSLKKLTLDVKEVEAGREITIRAIYSPLRGRNVETIIHLPWRSFGFFIRNVKGTPQKLAEWLKSLNATICQPLLHEANDIVYYRGLPEDTVDPLVASYEGDFFAEFVKECHKRGIKVIAGVYLGHRIALKRHPEAAVVRRDGRKVKDKVCFNNPKGLEHSLEVIEDLLERYPVDGLILDDNFELQHYNCYCEYCKEGFRRYCAEQGLGYKDPSRLSPSDPLASHWLQYKLEATHNLARQVVEIAHRHNLPAGGWVGVGMQQAQLGKVFDFLGGMVYTTPPRAARLMLYALGETEFFTLLWAPNVNPEDLEREFQEAIWAGSSTVGFWVYPPGHPGTGGFRMLEGTYEAISRAFSLAEKEWLKFYCQNLLSGDPRFVVVSGRVGREGMFLKLRNTGRSVKQRIFGTLRIERTFLTQGNS